MTENKRFTQIDEDDWEILDRNKHFAYAHSGYQAEKIIQELNELVETNRELYKENKKLKEENEQLKQELKIYRKIASCSNCEYQNYDWFDDGDEFEVCERGNNEQQIEYHICKEWSDLE